MGNKRQVSQDIPGALCFSFTNGPSEPKKAKRSTFTADRKEEVAGVRKVGACFRCQLMKIPVSLGTALQTDHQTLMM
jgi:hypothetical protein